MAKWFYFGIDLKPGRNWRDDALNLAEFDAWDDAERARRGWLAGLSFWTKTNVKGERILLSRHWPHLLCWSWSIRVGWRNRSRPRRAFAFLMHRRYKRFELSLFGPFIEAHWQDYGHMAAVSRNDAPKIVWTHHQTRSAEDGEVAYVG
jgi:hypothetical protein